MMITCHSVLIELRLELLDARKNALVPFKCVDRSYYKHG
jgi:hypothetical protein